jgi:hypothetical protein
MIANALPRPLTAGSVDNAILRADGTDGTILQTSGLIVDDAVVPYSVTGDAATDVITATGHIYTANQTVIFSAITGGAGLSANTVYFVRNPSGNTFQLSTTSGGAAINFTTNITAGTVIAIQANVAISQNTTETNSALVLTPKGTGALIAGPKPDANIAGGGARGPRAVDLQLERSLASQVASGSNSVIGGGKQNTASSTDTVVSGGFLNQATGGWANVSGGSRNVASGTFAAAICGGTDNTVSASYASILGGRNGVADRQGMQVHSGGSFVSVGDAQRARFVLWNKTTNTTSTELFLNGTSTRLTIPSGKVLALTINICGISSTGAAVAHYMRQYALKNVAATTSEVYAPITIGTDNAAGTSLSLTFNDPADALVVSVTGTASTIWRWVASVDAVEIQFGT